MCLLCNKNLLISYSSSIVISFKISSFVSTESNTLLSVSMLFFDSLQLHNSNDSTCVVARCFKMPSNSLAYLNDNLERCRILESLKSALSRESFRLLEHSKYDRFGRQSRRAKPSSNLHLSTTSDLHLSNFLISVACSRLMSHSMNLRLVSFSPHVYMICYRSVRSIVVLLRVIFNFYSIVPGRQRFFTIAK